MPELYLTYTHTASEITTVDEFLNQGGLSIAIEFINKKIVFLQYDGETGKSNLDRIYEKYSFKEKQENLLSYNSGSLDLLKVNTRLLIPVEDANREILSIEGKNQVIEQKDFVTFLSNSLFSLLKDPKYKKSTKHELSEGEYKDIYPNISVWLYSKAEKKILNLSPFITNINTSVSKGGGNFSFTLPPINTREQVESYDFEYYSDNVLYRNEEFERNTFYFHDIISQNDIVWIKFEELELEKRRDDKNNFQFYVSKNNLPNQVYDMIGLVDQNTIASSFGNTDVAININGRDLTKLIIEDGSYFFPLQFAINNEDLFLNLQEDTRLLSRLFTTGTYETQFSYAFRSVEDTMKFVINQLANISVVDNDEGLFSSYGERVTQVYRLSNETDQDFKEEPHQGIWQIIKLAIDEKVRDRRLADSSISQPDGSLITQFQKICQEPFVEFFTDTYNDEFYFIARQPPFTGEAIRKYVNNEIESETLTSLKQSDLVLSQEYIESQQFKDLVIDIEEVDVINESLSYTEDDIYTWFQIEPKGAFIGDTNYMYLAYIPIVYFPEYAEIWGSRKLQVQTNYISYNAMFGNKQKTDRDAYKEQIVNDFAFMIESYAYMPFTRKGTITINGDRRIKRGTWVRLKGTKEIFYVDTVSHSYSIGANIDRTTTLNLSRGMVEKYINNVSVPGLQEKVSYFNIVDVKLIKEFLIKRLTDPNTDQATTEQVNVKVDKSVKSNFGVNTEVFDFFLKRRQKL